MKKIFTLLLFSSLFSFGCGTVKDKNAVKEENTVSSRKIKKQVYFFAGQSNMDGRADASALSEEDLKRLEKVADRFEFYFNGEPVSKLQVTKLTNARLKKTFEFEEVFGPELFFGIEMAEKYPDQKFIFIKYSRGATSLYGAWNPNWSEEKVAVTKEQKIGKLYFEFKDYAKKVLSSYNENDYELKGMLWVQGEKDSNKINYTEKPSLTYKENLQNLIKAVRDDFNAPNLPFAAFQTGKGKVNKAMAQAAKEDDNVFVILRSEDKSSEDFYEKYPKPKGHYTTESMKRIGTKFFKIFSSISN